MCNVIEDLIEKEIKFTVILAKSIAARNAVQEHKCGHSLCPHHDMRCNVAHKLAEIDCTAFKLAIEAITKRDLELRQTLRSG